MVKKKDMLPMLSIVAIIASVFVALYSLNQLAIKKSAMSDEVSSIETDLNSTNFDSVDKESAEIESLLHRQGF